MHYLIELRQSLVQTFFILFDSLLDLFIIVACDVVWLLRNSPHFWTDLKPSILFVIKPPIALFIVIGIFGMENKTLGWLVQWLALDYFFLDSKRGNSDVLFG